jgi:putative endonuclease
MICSAESSNTDRAKAVDLLKKYNITKLVYFESGDDINLAIAREKQIKAGSRKKKVELIESINPEWKDLFEEYFGK